MVRYIPLVNSKKQALVDDHVYRYLKHFKWFESAHGYAVSRTKERTIFMHRVVNDTAEGFICDHINGLRLDNRECNLRTATMAQNSTNRNIVNKGKSRYRGVTWSNRDNKWRVLIQANGKRKHIGMFDNEEEAARAYNEEAVKLHGEFAVLNELLTTC